jgi:hypothetical protein
MASKLNQEYINCIKNSVTDNEIEAVINILPKKKNPEPDRFTAEFYQTLKKLTPMFLKQV